MKGLIKAVLLLPAILIATAAWDAKAEAKAGVKAKEASVILDDLRWLGHDTFRITGEKVIYTDPFQIEKTGPVADIILITHEHRDHCSPEDVKKVSGPGTTIVTTPDCLAKLEGIASKGIRTVKPGDRITVDGIEVEAVRAYNTNKKFHPRENNWVGYVFKAGDLLYYLAGDTDLIPEMKDIKCDVALLPVSGTYVMTAEEAVEAALDIRPRVAVPMHYGAIVGERSDADRFASALKGKVDVRILDKE